MKFKTYIVLLFVFISLSFIVAQQVRTAYSFNLLEPPTNAVYGEMWFHNDTNFKTLVTPQNVVVNVSFNSTDSEFGTTLKGFTHTEACNCLIATISGVYDSDYSISTGNAGNNQEYQFFIAINNIAQDNTDTHRKIGSSGDVGNDGGGGFLNISGGDVINFQTVNEDGNANLQIHASNLHLVKIDNL